VSSVKAYLQLARWPNALLAAFAVLAASQVGHVEGEFIPDPVLGAMLAALCLTVTANSSNDAADSEIDRVAHPERPIPRGAFQVKEARAIALSAALCGEIFATLASMWLGIISVFAIALMFLYSWRIKRYGVAGNITVAVLASLPFLYGAWAVHAYFVGLLLAGLAAPLHFAREIAKDIEDMDADATAGRRTIPIVLGAPGARRVILVTLLIYAVACIVLFHAEWKAFVVFAPALLLFGWGAWRVTRAMAGASRIFKAGMLVATVILFFVIRPIY